MMESMQDKTKRKTKDNQEIIREQTVKNAKENGFKIMLTFEKSTGIHLHPIGLSKAIDKIIGSVVLAKCLGQGRVLIIVKDIGQKNKLLKIKEMNGEKITPKEIGVENGEKGVIYGIPTYITTDEMHENIRGGKVINVRRLYKTKEGQRQESLSVLLTFEGKMPEKVQMGYISYPVRVYVPMPLRCFKCQRMGHVAAVCRGKVRCAKCGGEHDYDKCTEVNGLKCCNCGGSHSAAYGGCEVQMKAREVQKYKAEYKVTYAEAVKVCKSKEDRREEMRDNLNQDSRNIRMGKTKESEQQHAIKENALIMTKENFLAFIVKVINVTAMLPSRSAKIKTILEAASEFLGISGISVSAIHEILTRATTVEVSQVSE